ncbi:hypothetical protein [Hyphomicrobium sulfonivorans]|uniref:hypothetical protein n=1 Tax=Hyphomicrobium sulfonivorans TaxID=121290 RepID=UPI000B2485C2|nr:hypothetical protein [Hyphomicrobium sulfonivorans]
MPLHLPSRYCHVIVALPTNDQGIVSELVMIAASGEEMLPDMIASIILVGMMLVPILNIFVGVIVGAGIAGVSGAALGLLVALLIMAAEHITVSGVYTTAFLVRPLKRANAILIAQPQPFSVRRNAVVLRNASRNRAVPRFARRLKNEQAPAHALSGMVGVRPSEKSPLSISY